MHISISMPWSQFWGSQKGLFVTTGCFSDYPYERRAGAVALSHGGSIRLARLNISAVAIWWPMNSQFKALEVHSLSFWPYGPHFSTTSFGMGIPFHSALVICLFALRPNRYSQLCITEDRPLHTICQLFCQPALDEVWPVGGTRGDWREVGWVRFPGLPLQSTTNSVLEANNLESRCWQGHTPSKG